MLLVIYLAGWLPGALAAYAAGRRLSDRHTPADHSMMVIVSLAAGALWPLLTLGLVELCSIMVLTSVASKTRNGVGIFA
jgi:hypothetical protein